MPVSKTVPRATCLVLAVQAPRLPARLTLALICAMYDTIFSGCSKAALPIRCKFVRHTQSKSGGQLSTSDYYCLWLPVRQEAEVFTNL